MTNCFSGLVKRRFAAPAIAIAVVLASCVGIGVSAEMLSISPWRGSIIGSASDLAGSLPRLDLRSLTAGRPGLRAQDPAPAPAPEQEPAPTGAIVVTDKTGYFAGE